jgi:DNA-binding HxlR family transcriptional regulator
MDATALDKMQDCPVMETIVAVGGKWKPRILWALRPGPLRFGVLQRATGASTRMLTRSLRELEDDNLIDRTAGTDGAVPTTLYAYSAYGCSLIPVLDAMGDWGICHRSRR